MAYKPVKRDILIPTEFYTTLKKWNYERVGKLVIAAYEYVLNGVYPDFGTDELLQTVFEMYRVKLDADGSKYDDKILSKQYSGWCSSLKDTGQEYLKIPYEEYKEAKKQYDSIPDDKKPLFTSWIAQKRDKSINAEDFTQFEGQLPF